MLIITGLHRAGPLALCVLKAQEVTTKSLHRLPNAIYCCSSPCQTLHIGFICIVSYLSYPRFHTLVRIVFTITCCVPRYFTAFLRFLTPLRSYSRLHTLILHFYFHVNVLIRFSALFHLISPYSTFLLFYFISSFAHAYSFSVFHVISRFLIFSSFFFRLSLIRIILMYTFCVPRHLRASDCHQPQLE